LVWRENEGIHEQPVISIDTKKKELIGAFKNGGSDYREQGCPDEVNVHDFVDEDLGKVAPYGVYDITAANSDAIRPPFRFDVGHHSEMKPATRAG